MFKSEVIVVNLGYQGNRYGIKRIPVKIPGDEVLDQLQGHVGKNLLMDISGVEYACEKFLKDLRDIKAGTDALEESA